MGCDIHSYVEVKHNGIWTQVHKKFPLSNWEKELYHRDFGDRPFNYRHYGLFGWLADVRNYSGVKSLAPRRGLPADVSSEVYKIAQEYGPDGHSHSWIRLQELLEVDYNEIIWDRRVTRQITPNFSDGRCTTDNPKEGKRLPLRKFLGSSFFKALEVLETVGEPENVRIVFWFDN